MLARMLYGGGLALVAAQLFADGHSCGPGCSGAVGGYHGNSPYEESAPMPPNFDSAYYRESPSADYGERPPTQLMDPRGMMSIPRQQFTDSDRMLRAQSFGSPMTPYPTSQQRRRGENYRGYGRHLSSGRWNDHVMREQGGFNRYQAEERQSRDFGVVPRIPEREDYRPMPQPSLSPRNGAFHRTMPPAMPPSTSRPQPWSSQRPVLQIEPSANPWNI